jgi:ABC-2 type transport system permease protein
MVNKALIVAMTDLRAAMKLRFVKMGLVVSAIFGPIMVVLTVAALALAVPVSEFSLVWSITSPFMVPMIGIFAVLPATMISANALVGEREQKTLEPLLCTPLTDKELLWGKTISSALPSLVILIISIVISMVGSAAVLVMLSYPLVLIPDLDGIFFLLTATPLLIFAVVAFMIMISGRVSRVYEAYQTSGAIVIVFMIPMMLPLVGLGSNGAPDPNIVLFSNVLTIGISAALFAIFWVIALRMFNRDKLVSMV